MSATDLKKTLKELRPTFTSVEQEVEYHQVAKKALANRERMAAVRAAKKCATNVSTSDPSMAAAPGLIPAGAPKKASKVNTVHLSMAPAPGLIEEGPVSPLPPKRATKKAAVEPPASAKREALLAQLAALGSD